jgi:chemotaxis signal transduction protein
MNGIDWTAVRERLAKSQEALASLMEVRDERFDALLRERARKLAERRTAVLPARASAQALVVRAGAESFGLELTRLAGVLPFAQCAPVAGATGELIGLINAHGEIWAAFELRRLLGAAVAPPSGGYVVLLRHGRRRIGLRVDDVDRVREVGGTQVIEPGKGAVPMDYVQGVTSDAVILVDLDRLWTHPAIGEAA